MHPKVKFYCSLLGMLCVKVLELRKLVRKSWSDYRQPQHNYNDLFSLMTLLQLCSKASPKLTKLNHRWFVHIKLILLDHPSRLNPKTFTEGLSKALYKQIDFVSCPSTLCSTSQFHRIYAFESSSAIKTDYFKKWIYFASE